MIGSAKPRPNVPGNAGEGLVIWRMRLTEHVWFQAPSHCLIALWPDSRQNETSLSNTRRTIL
jgi:hypothetical protein